MQGVSRDKLHAGPAVDRSSVRTSSSPHLHTGTDVRKSPLPAWQPQVLPSPHRFPSTRVLIQHYYRQCSTGALYGTAVSAAVSIVFSNTVRAERSDRPKPYDTNMCPARRDVGQVRVDRLLKLLLVAAILATKGPHGMPKRRVHQA